MKRRWMAVCPRCERFYIMEERRHEWWCACIETSLLKLLCSKEVPMYPTVNKTLCKIVEVS